MSRLLLVFSFIFLPILLLAGDGKPCETITADDLLNTDNPQAPNFYMGGVTAGTPTPIDDFVIAQFFSGEQGTFDLGSGDNTNYATCNQCILVHEDVDTSSNPKTVFFQKSGTITVSKGNPTNGSGAGSLVNVTLEEVTVDPTTYQSTPVPNGRCLYLKVLVFKPRETETPDDDNSGLPDADNAETPDNDNAIPDDSTHTDEDMVPDRNDDDTSSAVDIDTENEDADNNENSDEEKTTASSDGCTSLILF